VSGGQLAPPLTAALQQMHYGLELGFALDKP
jgi:hypothetical protein